MRHIIHDVVKHTYKKPVVYNRDDDESREVAKKVPPKDLASTKDTKAGTGKGSILGELTGVVNVEVGLPKVYLGVPKMDEKVDAARYARERILGRIVDKELEAAKSAQSKKKRKRKSTKLGESIAGSVRGSLNDSVDYSSSPPPKSPP